MKVLISACVAGHDVRWNGANKKSNEILEWAHSVGLTLVPVCPENMLLGTPRPPIKMKLVGQEIHAVVRKNNIFSNLRATCESIQNEHADALGFIGIGGSPTCGISVGVKKLGKTVKGVFHECASFPTTEISQLKTLESRTIFLKRIKKYASRVCKCLPDKV